jgi:regulator of protease activity HflC (stomatin/prohibitin superfamily)
MSDGKILALITSGALLFLGSLVVLGMWGCPQWNVYSQKMEGEAQLAHAEYSKKVQVQDALGKYEAAKSLANAEVERAKGVAQANKIIGSSLQGNEAYLRYLYINSLAEKEGEVIYVPTEAGLPILEAGKRK